MAVLHRGYILVSEIKADKLPSFVGFDYSILHLAILE